MKLMTPKKTQAQQRESMDDQREDSELIASIAAARDELAFAELLRRYEHDAFNVAYHITGNRESAEEMVQDGMMLVWKNAATYRGEGKVRNWLLRIVARSSIRLIRSRKGKSVTIEATLLSAKDERSTHPSIESTELADALREEFNRLPELERQLVALRFAGGLTQEEISAELSIPQQTVSYRISETLKLLRGNLVATGHAAVVPLLAANALSDVLSSGLKAPSSLRASILKKCHAQSSVRMRNSRGASTTAQRSSWALWAAGALVATAIGGAIWISRSQTPSIAQASSPAIPAPPVMDTKPPQQADAALPHLADWHRHWTFEKGMPKDLSVIMGQWTWNSHDQTIETMDGVRLYPMYQLPAEPLVFTIKAKCLDLAKTAGGTLELFTGSRTANVSNVWKQSPHLTGSDITFKLYLYHRKFIALTNDALTCSLDNDIDPENTVAVFVLYNIAVHDISVAPLKEDEIPDYVRDPKPYMKN
jgi:RNA polymerase sigma-70 factor (ECF subfamily)